jgi:hypothetical protein
MDDDAITFNSLGLEGSPERPQYAVHAPDATQEDTIIARTVAVAEQWRSRATRRLTPKRPLPNWAIPVIIAVLLAIVLPSVLAVAAAVQDYSSLKNLGQSGVRHLLNAKTDLSGLLDGVSSNGSLSSLLNGSGSTLGDAPYTLFVQRQGGTLNQVTVTIHPASNMAKSIKTTTYRQTIDTNTALTLGGTAPATSSTKASPTPTATTTPTKSGSAGFTFDPAAIDRAVSELHAAQSDFLALRNKLANPDWVLSFAPHVPGVGSQVSTVMTLANVGYDASTLGVVLADSAKPLFDRIHSASLAGNGNSELITQSDMDSLQAGLTQGQSLFDRLQQELSSVQVNTLPISASQKALLTKAITLMPSFKGLFTQASDYLNMVGWLAGADAPRTFLIQTLDKGELRGTGGFEGFYSILNVDHGKVGSIVLQRANDLDYGTAGCGKGVNNWSINNPAPAAYVKWWPFANWGLRDANLNSDFPTSAKLIMNAYSHEACSNVDGVIQFTPEAIASVLRVTGPLQVPVFNEKVTADNLEAKIHYYEESDAGIAKAQALFHDFNPADKNKIRTRFTEAVEQLLETHVRHLPKSELIPLAKQFLADLRSKEVQVYFNNKSVEGYLQKLHADGAIDTTPGVDGLFVSQVNVSVSKGSPYVATTISDNVTLDTKGGATHQLRIAIKNNAQSGVQVAGYVTYRDYVRIYVPAGAQLQYADGFDSGTVMCVAPPTTLPVTPPTPPGPPTPPTPPTAPTCGSNPYPGGERVCPATQYLPLKDSQSNYLKNAQPGNKPGTLNKVGGPTATTSDVPNLTMWGGYVVIPQYCTANLTLNYYVPNVVNKNAGAATPTTAPTTSTTPTGALFDPRRRAA